MEKKKCWFKNPKKVGLVYKMETNSLFCVDVYDPNYQRLILRGIQQVKNVENWLRLRMN